MGVTMKPTEVRMGTFLEFEGEAYSVPNTSMYPPEGQRSSVSKSNTCKAGGY
jgi:hypothetical protein